VSAAPGAPPSTGAVPASPASRIAARTAVLERVSDLELGDAAHVVDAVFQLHVETETRLLEGKSTSLGAFEPPVQSIHLAGTWPNAAWALVTRMDPKKGFTSRLHRRKGDRWVEVMAAGADGVFDYAFGAWTNDRVVVVRGEAVGGNMQSLVVPEPVAFDDAGQRHRLAVPKGFIADAVVGAPSGELFMRGRTPPEDVLDVRSVRPLVARWTSNGSTVVVDSLPTDLGEESGMWVSRAEVSDLCVQSPTAVVAVGREEDRSERQQPAVWRFDGAAWSLEKLAVDADLWGLGCTDDGAVWIGRGTTLARRTTGDEESLEISPSIQPTDLVTTRHGDVFVIGAAAVHRLRR
jgi:hypothetical protein